MSEDVKLTLHDQKDDALDCRYSIFCGSKIIMQFNPVPPFTAQEVFGLIERGSVIPPAPRADRPDVAEVERLAEAWVSMAAAYGYGEPGAEHRMIMTKAAFLTALRALGDAEWDRAKSMIADALCEGCREKQPFHDETENFHVHPTYGRGFSCKAVKVRSLRRTPAGG